MKPPLQVYRDLLANYICRSDRILIGAGAGMSAAAGIDYGDGATFAKLFPPLVKKGFRCQYDLIGFSDWSEEESWAYWATHVNYVRFQFPPSPLYVALRKLIEHKDYFVITTNVDAMFFKTGFAADRIYTPQGDYARLQCVRPCTSETWSTKPVIDRILPAIGEDKFVVGDPQLIPHCPLCGGRVFLNVRLDGSYVHAPYNEQLRRYKEWLRESVDKKLLVLELGVGFISPGVIRWPFEGLVDQLTRVRFIRINDRAPEIPHKISDKSLSIRGNIADVIMFQGNR